jgi:hypothetical protein
VTTIRQKVITLGEQEWSADRKKGSADWRHWKGCQLVNPLCPDDLCVLPKNHVGTEQGYHILGTTAWDNPLHVTKRSVLFLLQEETGDEREVDREGLIRIGWTRQQELWPNA